MKISSSLTGKSPEILVVGAGLTGITAASLLAEKKRVLVLDKGRQIGGRLADHEIAGARFDKGGQFVTVRDDRFAKQVKIWRKKGVIKEWYRKVDGQSHETLRLRGLPNMRTLAFDLAKKLNIYSYCRVEKIMKHSDQWRILLENREQISAEAIILTPPVPQSIDLIDNDRVPITALVRQKLERITYDPCLAVMALLDSPSKIPAPGAVIPEHHAIDWISDNQQKGVSSMPAITIHASAEYSAKYSAEKKLHLAEQLIEYANPWVGANVTKHQSHFWKYSKPIATHPEPFIVANESPSLVIAGDAFAGPRIEGAFLSGWEAANYLLDN